MERIVVELLWDSIRGYFPGYSDPFCGVRLSITTFGPLLASPGPPQMPTMLNSIGPLSMMPSRWTENVLRKQTNSVLGLTFNGHGSVI